MLRIIRPIKLISKRKSIELLLKSIFESLQDLLHIILFVLLVWLIKKIFF